MSVFDIIFGILGLVAVRLHGKDRMRAYVYPQIVYKHLPKIPMIQRITIQRSHLRSQSDAHGQNGIEEPIPCQSIAMKTICQIAKPLR